MVNVIKIAFILFSSFTLYFTFNNRILFEDYIEIISVLGVAGVIIYNEIKQSRQLDVISLISLREETHAISGRLETIQAELEHRALRTELLEHRIDMTNQLEEYKTELSSNLDELNGNIKQQIDTYIAMVTQEHDQYEEASQKATSKKSYKTKK